LKMRSRKHKHYCQQSRRIIRGEHLMAIICSWVSLNTGVSFILLGYALDKVNLPDEAEKAYQDATQLRPNEFQAWQGLIKLYERQGAKSLANYQLAVVNLAQLLAQSDEMYKSQELVDKFIDFARAKGSRIQLVEAYNVILPASPIYPYLEGRVPSPGQTYQRVAKLLEEHEMELLNTTIGQRRGMIGTKLSDITLEAKREVHLVSKLPNIYRELINWTADDEARRLYEEKLLYYVLDQLLAAPDSKKGPYLQEVRKLANDMVIIKHPLKAAWDITLDWQDYKDISEWDTNLLRQYTSFFPESDLSKVLAGFLSSSASPFPHDEGMFDQSNITGQVAVDGDDESQDEEDGGAPTSIVPLTDEDRLLTIADGVSGTESLLAYRLAAAYYESIEEHESIVELMGKAQGQLTEQRRKTGLRLANTQDAINLFLATAYVFYQTPRHHQEAKRLLDQILEHDPKSTSALIGVGLIYEEEEDYDEAIKFLDRALARDADNLRVRTEAAWVRSLAGLYKESRDDLEACIPLLSDKGQHDKKLLAQTQYRLGVCLWNIETSRSARKDRTKAYAQFINALKNDLNCAPAYTSLGVYYADYAKDRKRARKCFQKAVELSASEVISAERLARSFADEGDWDRVELVAQRVVDSGKVKPPPGSKRKGISWPFAALGVAQLNKQEYTKSIAAFQAATRISPSDYHSFIGLAESYHNTGKHMAAMKAIQEAQRLEVAAGINDASETWFTKFLLANIQREIGAFDEAISLYLEAIDARNDEEGVAIALMQTMVDGSLISVEQGYYGKAVGLAAETLKFALQAPVNITVTFNYWKAVGDACSVFSTVQGRVTEFPTEVVQKLLGGSNEDAGLSLLSDLDGVHNGVLLAKGLFPEDEKVGVELTRTLHATILAHKRAIHVSTADTHAHAVAYYNLGWAEHRAHRCLPASLRSGANRYLKASVRCFKRAIELEAGNPDFWNALGVVTSTINPAVAQHAFARSLYLNERSAHVWTNLGALGLLQNDTIFANNAFTNAQSNEPDYAHGWVGQGLVALLLGRAKEARGHFTQAMELAQASSCMTRQLYSISTFDHIMSLTSDASIQNLVLPVFALSQLLSLRPREFVYVHLYALFQERVKGSPSPLGVLEQICTTLKAEFEVSNSAESFKHLTIANADLARACLAAGRFERAIQYSDLALRPSSVESTFELTEDERKRTRVSAYLTIGLASYYIKDLDRATECFDLALEESSNNPDAVCILAQVLWANGSDESRERARDVLFEVIETRPDHVPSVLLLGVVALLDGDQDSLEAVLSELHDLQLSDKVTPSEQEEIGAVLQAIMSLSMEADVEGTDEITQAQTNIMLHPHLPHGWSNLAAIAGRLDEYPASMALNVALKSVPPRGDLGAADLAHAYAGTRSAANAQEAIVVAPWLASGWDCLADAVAR
jgi:superkiller protein 3